MEQDIAEFFALPVPLEVWKTIKPFQDREFVEFVEGCGVSDQADEISEESRQD